MQIKLEHLLIVIIILFGLYLLMDRCRCNGNRRVERFSISTSALKTYLETFGDEKYVDYREQIINDMNEAAPFFIRSPFSFDHLIHMYLYSLPFPFSFQFTSI